MRRRTFVTAAVSATTIGLAGCLDDTEVTAAGSNGEHTETLRKDIDDRGVEVHEIDTEEATVTVEHGYEKPNDAVANVAMAFVDRVAEGWDVDRLDGYLTADDRVDYTWHAEAAWAQDYADGEINPDEYGERISETFTVAFQQSGESA